MDGRKVARAGLFLIQTFQELRGLKKKRKVDNNVPLPVGVDL